MPVKDLNLATPPANATGATRGLFPRIIRASTRTASSATMPSTAPRRLISGGSAGIGQGWALSVRSIAEKKRATRISHLA